MNNLERKLENISQQVEQLRRQADVSVTGAGVLSRLDVLRRRLDEHRNGSFIVLVVGGTKSGKSTLVNLLAHRYVSPTDKLECTVRPSIVSGVDNAADEMITVYKSAHEGRQAADLDIVVDGLRGLEISADDRAMLQEEQWPLTGDNIDRVVFPAFNASDDTLITGITTAGSPLLAPRAEGQVFVVDMPGFDGSKANFAGDARYEAMSRRVDLVLFVHSSVTAVGVAAADYLQSLRLHNPGVPVVLLHNVFDTAHWRADDSRAADAERQMQAEREEIQSKGFNISVEHCHAINLGMVADHRAGDNVLPEYRAALEAEAQRFETFEVSLRDLIVNNISDMRVNRCLGRAGAMRDEIVAELDTQRADLDERLARQRAFKDTVASLRAECSMPRHAVSDLVKASHADAEQCASVFNGDISGGVRSMDNEQCEAHLTALAKLYFEAFDTRLSLAVYDWYTQRVADYARSLNTAVPLSLPRLTRQTPAMMPIFLPDGVRQFFPGKFLSGWFKHSADDISGYVRVMRDKLLNASVFELRVTAVVEQLAAAYVAQIERHYDGIASTLASDGLEARRDAIASLARGLRDIIF